MSDDAGQVLYEEAGRVATVVLDRPSKLNAITPELHRRLCDAVRRFDADPEKSVLVLRANGRSFCAGRDLQWQAETGESPTKNADREISPYGLPPTDKLVVTSARGHALGAGAYFLMAGDVRVVSRTLAVGLTEVRTAVLGPYWIKELEQLPSTVAFRIAVLGETFDAEQLAEYHLVTEVVEDDELDAATQRWVDRLLELPIQHAIATKRMMQRVGYQYDREAIRREDQVRAILDELEDTREAARAFVERRPPRFVGR